jgi:hypothetical protein
LSSAEGRRFGLTVGIPFLLLGAVTTWRGAAVTPYVFFGLGGLMLLAALVAPTQLGPVEKAWMKLAHLISKVTTPLFMGVVYFLIFTPMGLVRRLLGKDSLRRDRKAATYWMPATPAGSMERQF